MAGRRAVAALGFLLLGACAGTVGGPAGPETPPAASTRAAVAASLDGSVAGYQREVAEAFTEAPFEYGAMSVVATEGSELSTYQFVPCRDNRAVCAGSPDGAAGRVLRTPDYLVIAGLYGRLFWLSWGGDGWVERDGTFVPLAWNARRLGTGAGIEPVLETPAPHALETPVYGR